MKTLCKPCTLGMIADGKKLKATGGRCEKITCAGCGRRRFGLTYEITERERDRQREAADDGRK